MTAPPTIDPTHPSDIPCCKTIAGGGPHGKRRSQDPIGVLPAPRPRPARRLDGGRSRSRNGDSIAEFNPIPSTHGMFHIYVNDELVASHQHMPDAHLFPDLKDMMVATLARI